MQMSHSRPAFSITDLAYISVTAALLAVCAWISIPSAVPFTLQTFGVFLALSLLGGRRGTAAILVYLLLGAAGIPVFSGFTSGIGILLGSTGGYLTGFLLIGLVYWGTTKHFTKKPWAEISGLLLGLILCYVLGTAWFFFIYARHGNMVGLDTVLSWCVFPFILPDLFKMALALALSRRIAPTLKLSAR